jgi:membrane protease YdiL (CAAX protease family)
VVWAFLWVGLGVPFVEEFFFRGVLQAALQRALHPALAVAGSALAFGLAHLEPSLVLMALPLGVLCGAITAWSGSIWPAVAAHVAWNLATISASYVPSAELRLGRLVPIVAVALTVGLVWRRRPS